MIGRFRSNATQLSQNISNTRLSLGFPCKCNTHSQSEIAALLFIYTDRSHPPPPLIFLLLH